MTRPRQSETTEHIWRELSDRLRRFIRSRVTGAADVDDILQTVFLRIHEKLDGLRRTDRLEAWVFQIARNAVADHFRAKGVRHDATLLAEAVDPPDAKNQNAEVAGCIAALIDHLPEDQKRAVTLYELEGVSQQEIAGRESISLSGAKSRIQRGREKVEAMLRDCCRFQLDARGNVLEYEAVGDACCRDQ